LIDMSDLLFKAHRARGASQSLSVNESRLLAEDQIRRTTARAEKAGVLGAYDGAAWVTCARPSMVAGASGADGGGATGSGTGDCSQHGSGAALIVVAAGRAQQPCAEASLGPAMQRPSGTQGSQDRRIATAAVRTQRLRGRAAMREAEHGGFHAVKMRMVKRCIP
jgi:hypothetical protein